MALLHDYLKQQHCQNDVWTTREQLCLASAVVKNGDQNWVAVSRTCRSVSAELNRPADWYSTKNCAFQYAKLLEKVDTPKRNREKGEMNFNEAPSESLTRMLTNQRIEELKSLTVVEKENYEKLVKHINCLECGQYDHRINQIWEQTIQEQSKKEEEETLQEEWLRQRCEKSVAMQKPSRSTLPIADSQQKVCIEESTSSEIVPLQKSTPCKDSENVNIEDNNGKVDDVVVKIEVPDIEERIDSGQEETQSSQVSSQNLEAFVKIQQEETNEVIVPMQSSEITNVASLQVENLSEGDFSYKPADVSTQQFASSELTYIPTESGQKLTDDSAKHSKRADDLSKNDERNADDIYAFDSDPESSSDKKRITSFSLSRDEPKKGDKYETFKSSRKRKRNVKESVVEDQPMQKDDSRKRNENMVKINREDHDEFEFPKKLRRIPKKEDEEESRRKPVEVDDDEISRDSTEVKEILMFVKSDRRRVYGHDDTASPVISESTPSSPASTYYGDDSESEKIYKTWKKSIMLVWNDIAAHKNASIFLRPISQDKLPGYHSVIYKPTDLQTIKRQIETGVVKTTLEFEREMLLLFLNAKMYNPKDHNVYQMAQEMMKDCVATIEEFDNTQLLAKSMDTPQKSLRRETRESSSAKRGELGVKRKRK